MSFVNKNSEFSSKPTNLSIHEHKSTLRIRNKKLCVKPKRVEKSLLAFGYLPDRVREVDIYLYSQLRRQ